MKNSTPSQEKYKPGRKPLIQKQWALRQKKSTSSRVKFIRSQGKLAPIPNKLAKVAVKPGNLVADFVKFQLQEIATKSR